MTKTLYIFFLLYNLILLSNCNYIKTKNNICKSSIDSIGLDTSKIAILPQADLNKGNKNIQLTSDDIKSIENILQNCITIYNHQLKEKVNKDTLAQDELSIHLENYKRQYMVRMNENKEKEVWVHCFCQTENLEWKKRPILIQDGGNCYFMVLINITKGSFSHLIINGNG